MENQPSSLASPCNTHSRSVSAPLIAHVIFRLDYGGLENGVINLIDRMPQDPFRHCIIVLTEATEFRTRLRRTDVDIHCIGKRPGKDPSSYVKLYKLLRKLRPTALHTRNIGTLDCVPVARLAGVSACIHGEHGWDIHDPDGKNPKYRRVRWLIKPLVRHFVTVSDDLRQWLVETVGIQPRKVTRICNGVDTDRFAPRLKGQRHVEISSRFGEEAVIVCSVLRFQEIKDPLNLVDAFLRARAQMQGSGVDVCLVMVGDGPLRKEALNRLQEAGAIDAVWLPGTRDDIAEILQSVDIFVLASKREGISNTLLEAMSTGLPLIATSTGGNVELLEGSKFGVLVPPEDSGELAEAIVRLSMSSDVRTTYAAAARSTAVSKYSLEIMVDKYRRLYENVTAGHRGN